MFHKEKAVTVLPDYHLSILFAENVTKINHVTPLFVKWEQFKALTDAPELFSDVEVDVGGYGIIWNDDLDLSCDELFEDGKTIKTPFDGLMALLMPPSFGGYMKAPYAKPLPMVSWSTAWMPASLENSG